MYLNNSTTYICIVGWPKINKVFNKILNNIHDKLLHMNWNMRFIFLCVFWRKSCMDIGMCSLTILNTIHLHMEHPIHCICNVLHTIFRKGFFVYSSITKWYALLALPHVCNRLEWVFKEGTTLFYDVFQFSIDQV